MTGETADHQPGALAAELAELLHNSSLTAKDQRAVRDAIVDSMLAGAIPDRESTRRLIELAAGRIIIDEYTSQVLKAADAAGNTVTSSGPPHRQFGQLPSFQNRKTQHRKAISLAKSPSGTSNHTTQLRHGDDYVRHRGPRTCCGDTYPVLSDSPGRSETLSPTLSDHRGFSRSSRRPSDRRDLETPNTLQQQNSQMVPENRAESDHSHVFPDYSQLVPDRTRRTDSM
ncbi:hypothetical protein ABQF35_03695 [Mycobacterium syngnathidarum]